MSIAYIEGTLDQVAAVVGMQGVRSVPRGATAAGGGRWRIGADIDDAVIPTLESLGMAVTVTFTDDEASDPDPPSATYPDSQAIFQALGDLSTQLVVPCTLGTDLEPSRNQEPIRYLRIGGSSPTAKKVLITAGIHAREWAPPAAVVSCFQKLIAAYPNAPVTTGKFRFSTVTVQKIIEQLEIYVAPLINPDGYDYSRQNKAQRNWRKNRALAPASIPADCTGLDSDGVDINRNFNIAWNLNQYYEPAMLTGGGEAELGSSLLPCDDTFVGPSAFSEPESRNVRTLLNKGIQYYIDCHSYGRWILYPWGMETNQHSHANQNHANALFDMMRGSKTIPYGEHIQSSAVGNMHGFAYQMNNAMWRSTGTLYRFTPSSKLYYATGTAADYAFSKGVKVALTLECGSAHERGFHPKYKKHFPKIEAEVQAAILRFLEQVTNEA